MITAFQCQLKNVVLRNALHWGWRGGAQLYMCNYRNDLYESEKPLESTSLTKAQSNTSPDRVLKVFPAGRKQTGHWCQWCLKRLKTFALRFNIVRKVSKKTCDSGVSGETIPAGHLITRVLPYVCDRVLLRNLNALLNPRKGKQSSRPQSRHQDRKKTKRQEEKNKAIATAH